MTDIPPLGTGAHLAFMAPLSAERADLLLRILAQQPDARGIGVETHGPDIARARDNASARGLSDRVEFIEGAAWRISARQMS